MRQPSTRQLATVLLIAAVSVALAILAPVAPAAAELVYVTGGFPTVPPKVPSAPWVWSAHNNGSAPRRLARGASPLVSPNGKLVAYETAANYQFSLRVISTTGGRSRMLLRNLQGSVAWSPDSRVVAAVTGKELGTKRLILIDVANGKVVRTLASAPEISDVAFSPRGTELLFTNANHTGLKVDVYRVSRQGGAAVSLTRDHSSRGAVWGPRSIVFSRLRKPPRRDDAPKADLYLMSRAGTNVKRLTRTNPGLLLEGLFAIAWSANGKRLLAEFGGQDTSYAETVDAVTGAVRRVGTAAQGLIGHGLSRDGRTILATTGGPDPGDSNVVTIPYRGGKLHVLARHAWMADWNAGYPG